MVSMVKIGLTGKFIFQGIDAEYVSLEDIVPISDDGDLHVEGSLDQPFYDSVAAAVGERIKECAPRVPVVTGAYHSPYVHASHKIVQVSLVLFRDRCCARLVGATRTSSLRYSLLASKPPN